MRRGREGERRRGGKVREKRVEGEQRGRVKGGEGVERRSRGNS